MNASLTALVEAARADVDDGPLPGCQLTLARHGEVVLSVALGDATTDDRYLLFSCTKALTAASVWRLLGDGRLELDRPAADLLVELRDAGLSTVTPRHLLTHTGGFPHAPMGPPEWWTSATRRQQMARWQPEWPPGERFEYHAGSGHWVLAELIQALTGVDHRRFFAEEVAAPLGSALTLGTTDLAGLRPPVLVGHPPSAEDLAALGLSDEQDLGAASDDDIALWNEPATMALGRPGGGGIGTAASLALFYQALLHNPGGLWDAEVLRAGTAEVACDLPDPLTGVPALRTLGLSLAGDDGLGVLRGYGEGCSGTTFGHLGQGGQIAWADPVSGLSFCYLTNGMDAELPNQWRRLHELSTLAAACAD
ncbi:MAG: beta-lactamase family protein [Acidimicrobiia bacterium]|nr:beta-lactamase family protein [Acidimicrobiia bacterium]